MRAERIADCNEPKCDLPEMLGSWREARLRRSSNIGFAFSLCGVRRAVLAATPRAFCCSIAAIRVAPMDAGWPRLRWQNLERGEHRANLRLTLRHAGDFADFAGAIEIFEPGIAVRMHPTLILCEMIFGVLPFAVWRELIPTGGWDTAAARRSIAAISPEPRCRLCLPVPGASILTGVSSAKMA